MSAVAKAGTKVGSAATDVKKESGTARLLGSGELHCIAILLLERMVANRIVCVIRKCWNCGITCFPPG